MTTEHQKMQQDYLWVRDHSEADSWAQARTFGQHYLYYHAPNKKERLEMTWRSLGKAYDWELEKFRMQKKYIDRGNKKRFIKNFLRFVKNPIGYAYWKTFKFRQAKGRFITMMLGIGFIGMLYKYKLENDQQARKAYYNLRSGKNVSGFESINVGYDNDVLARQQMPLTQMLYSNLYAKDIVVSPSRDQNYRKYFEMRKKYGIQE